MGGGGWASAPKVFVPIVDSAVIDKFSCGVEHRAFGRDGGLRALDQRVMEVAKGGNGVVKFREMSTNARCRLAGVGIDEPEIGLAMKFFLELMNRGRVAIRNRTIGPDKKKYQDSAVGQFERIRGLTRQIFSQIDLWRARSGGECKEESAEKQRRADGSKRS